VHLLLLGESHYIDEAEDQPDFTIDKVQQACTGNTAPTYFYSVSRIVRRDVELPGGEREFWEQVAFYNYLQAPLKSARLPPQKDWWLWSMPWFERAVAELRPTHVLFLGKRIWKSGDFGGHEMARLQARDQPVWRLPIRLLPTAPWMFATVVDHPSSSATTFDQRQRIVGEFLALPPERPPAES
jgi:hypothetical protein